MNEIPDDVRRFAAQYLTSLSALEILLFLRSNSHETWTAEAIGRALLMPESAVQARLETLRAFGLILSSDVSSVRHYRFAPSTPELSGTIDAVAQWYSTHPVAITTLIFSKPIDKIRVFADSFKLRKDEDK